MEGYGDTVTFLDITVYNAHGAVETEIYYKTTDTKKYFSYHLHQTFTIKRPRNILTITYIINNT